MTPFELVVWIVGIACMAGLIDTFIKSRRRSDDAEVSLELESRLAELDDLEERVRVLERVITDDRQSLAEEIRRLND